MQGTVLRRSPWMCIDGNDGGRHVEADFDNNGDADLLVTILNDRPVLLRNDAPRRGWRWMRVTLVGESRWDKEVRSDSKRTVDTDPNTEKKSGDRGTQNSGQEISH